MIPQIFHQVWPGEDEVPAYTYRHQDLLKQFYPDWEVMLWRDFTDERITGDLIERCPNYGAKSDIMRLEILYQTGGLYLDCDVEPLRRMPPFFDMFSHLTCKQNAGCGNWLMGAPPKSDVILTCLKKIMRMDYHIPKMNHHDTFVFTGPEMVSGVFSSHSQVTTIERDVMAGFFNHHQKGSWTKNVIMERSQ